MDLLKLENQLCFPIYALSRQITNLYRPLLDKLDLTYPQYLVMMLLWEHGQLSVKAIGEQLMLDSGTLTPLLKRMEKRELVTRTRDKQDERIVQIRITKHGEELKEKAKDVPLALLEQFPVPAEEGQQLVKQLRSILNHIK
ncbi:MarR family transcriptional regulator [Mucilaginibacter sp. Bleaf8]|uniref:MarR family winged helix-turn-helix transcriptional regulator n=1 Tax=Mucilaginibacter sp. Bleaf8 TaxID=2834430 RepID=UPI001BCFDF70|nr:MarR family transcriptional regulator [Mucilaginibacter sp. Bleaf8]MBS7565585.1 MarR family transcriptional regulator [Mucilaginibacter sp. Bleaf8]